MGVENITDYQFNKFINTGKVTYDILKKIAIKIKKNISLSQREMAIFIDKTGDIEEILRR